MRFFQVINLRAWTLMHVTHSYQPAITMEKGAYYIQVVLIVCMVVTLSHVCALPTTDEQKSGSNDAILQYLTSIIKKQCEQPLVACQ